MTPLQQRLRASLSQHRTKTAILTADETISYGQLAASIGALQAKLVEVESAGEATHPGSVALIALPQGASYVCAMLTCIQAGVTFLPVAVDLPAAKLTRLIERTGAGLLLAEGETLGRLAAVEPKRLRAIDVTVTRRQSSVDEALEPQTDATLTTATSVPYIITTSGSTGEPKLVQGNTHLLEQFLSWEAEYTQVSPTDRVSALTPATFDVSLRDSLLPLLHGATLCIPSEDDRLEPQSLLAWLQRTEITICHIVPTLARALVASSQHPSKPLALRHVLFAGEALTGADVRRWRACVTADATLTNLYGPSETTLAKCYHRIQDNPADDAIVPLGTPIADTKIDVIPSTDHDLEAPEGCIAGEIVLDVSAHCAGYFDNDIETRRTFELQAGRTRYRTGDLGYIDRDGNLRYLGRSDSQVKINGQRLELAEVENALRDIDGVEQAAVTTFALPHGELALAGYVVSSDTENGLELASIRSQLAASLPPHKRPARLQLIATMPLTASGKTDRKALPAPQTSRPPLSRPYAPPRTEAERAIAQIWSEALGIDRVGIDDPFFELGGHSLLAMSVLSTLQERTGNNVPIARFFDTGTVRGLSRLVDGHPEPTTDTQRPLPTEDHGERHRIAIVGMAGRFPGANDIEAFWVNLLNGIDSISRFTDAELDSSVPEDLRSASNYVAARGVIDRGEAFDAEFFGVRPREAELIDPQQRVLLEVAWQALEDAGVAISSAGEARSDIGVFAGVGDNTYLFRNLLPNSSLATRVGEHAIRLANEKDYVATRIAYKLNLSGPAVSVHTACSTSLVAVAQAVDALRAGRCDMALAGGAFVTAPQHSGYTVAEGGFASLDGICRPFADNASGTVFSSGAGVVALKPLTAAQRDGDRVIAVIDGVALNNDGADRASFMAPSSAGQSAVVRAAQADANVEASDIGYIEAHGTATPVGDPIEVQALADTWSGVASNAGSPCLIGSVKGNIGHLDAAAGVTGLIKAALMLSRSWIPQTLHVDRPNPALELARGPFEIATQSQSWAADRPRRAGISSFGVGGTNAHVVLSGPELTQASPTSQRDGSADRDDTSPPFLLVTAANEAALDRRSAALADMIESDPDCLGDVAYTLWQRRTHLPNQRLIAGRTVTESIDSLRTKGGAARPQSGERQLVFAFTGQGSQRIGMIDAVYERFPSVRDAVDAVAETAAPIIGMDIRELLRSAPEEPDRINQTQYTQTAMYASQVGWLALLDELGVDPQLMLGHSIGEYAAATAAGVFSIADGATAVAHRGRLMQALPEGSMAAVGLSADDLLAMLPGETVLAAANGPAMSVIAGPTPAIEAAVARFESDSIFARPLRTSHAFHSPMMTPMLEEFAEVLKGLSYGRLQRRLISTLVGRELEDAEMSNPEYWVGHVANPVRFDNALAAAAETGGLLTLLEVGPGNALTQLAKGRLDDAEGHQRIALSHTVGAENDFQALCRAAIELRGAGHFDSYQSLAPEPTGRLISLPPYPFGGQRYWIEPPEGSGKQGADSAATNSGDNASQNSDALAELLEALSGVSFGDDNKDVDLVELGFDSLLFTQLAQALKREFDIDLSLDDLKTTRKTYDAIASLLPSEPRRVSASGSEQVFAPQSIEPPEPGLALALDHRGELVWVRSSADGKYSPEFLASGQAIADRQSGEDNREATHVDSFESAAPLTSTQRELWLTEQMAISDTSGLFNEAAACELTGSSAIDLERLQAAVSDVIARHEALRSIPDASGQWLMVQRSIPTDIEWLDVCALSEKEIADRLVELASIGFDLRSGPLCRFHALQCSDKRIVLLFCAHHIVTDGFSKGVVLENIADRYAGRDLRPADSYCGYSMDRQDASEEVYSYWLDVFDTPPAPLELPCDYQRPPLRNFDAGFSALQLSSGELATLRRLAADAGVTLYTVLMSGLAALLARLSQQADLVIGIPASDQVHFGAEQLVGHCVSFLPLRFYVPSSTTVSSHFATVDKCLGKALENRDVSLGDLAERLTFERDPSRPGLVSVMFNVDAAKHDFDFGESIESQWRSVAKSSQNMELSFNLRVDEHGIDLQCGYSTALFAEESVKHWLSVYRQVLASFTTDTAAELGQLKSVPDDTLATLEHWGSSSEQAIWETSFIERIERRANLSPDRIALVSGDKQLTYSELWARVTDAASGLLDAGILPGESLVGVCHHRSEELLVALLAVLRVGAGYVPLDPALPVDRLSYMVADADLTAVIADQDAPAIFAAVPTLSLATLCNSAAPGSDSAPAFPTIDGDWTAYVIYTSGSTGKPKGVVLPHRAVDNFLRSMHAEPGIGQDDRLLSVTTLSFDISVLEFYLPLTVGARVILATGDEVLNGALLMKRLQSSGATIMQATPATWRLMLEAGWTEKLPVRALCGGEALPADLADSLLARCDELWNLYGPTETTVWSSIRRIDSPDDITIGRPIRATQLKVVSDEGHALPIGVPGELWIGGAGVAVGYLNREELTADRFVVDRQGKRWYRTGDEVRWRHDATLEYCNRLDSQVKVRGYRIELGEIESALNSIDSVEESAVNVTVADGSQMIVAYVAAPATLSSAELRKELRSFLPEYMLPNQIMVLGELPKTPNGKIDRNALPEPSRVARKQTNKPSTPAEAMVAGYWRALLDDEHAVLDTQETFFEAGGHSLLAARFVTAVSRELDIEVPVRELVVKTLEEISATYFSQADKASSTDSPEGAVEQQSDSWLSRLKQRWTR